MPSGRSKRKPRQICEIGEEEKGLNAPTLVLTTRVVSGSFGGGNHCGSKRSAGVRSGLAKLITTDGHPGYMHEHVSFEHLEKEQKMRFRSSNLFWSTSTTAMALRSIHSCSKITYEFLVSYAAHIKTHLEGTSQQRLIVQGVIHDSDKHL